MSVICTIVQLAAIFAGIFLMFDQGFSRGALLIGAVLGLHIACALIAKFLMWGHEKLFISRDQLRTMEGAARFHMAIAIPAAWRYIANVCALAFIVGGSITIYLFVT